MKKMLQLLKNTLHIFSRKKACLLIFLFIIGVFSVQAQERTLSGAISDEDGNPIFGVNVIQKNSSYGTISDLDGKFSIKISSGDVLVFSLLGMETQEVLINSQSVLNITLKENVIGLDEVVAVGYGIQKKSHLTGSIAKVEGQKLAEAPVANIDEALRGRIAGMQVRNTTGQVGDAQEVVIRGIASVNADNSPLVVIDGVPMPDMELSAVAAEDIESVEVLKDAASTAIYGSRGASGVILIATKNGGKNIKTKYSFRMQEGFKRQIYKYDVYDQFSLNRAKLSKLQMAWETPFLEQGIRPGRHFDDNGNPLPNPDGILYPTMDSYLGSNATERTKTMIAMETGARDWLGDMARDSPHFRQYSLSAQGGTKNLGFYISGNYQNNEGVLKDNRYERLYLRAKLTAKLSDNVDIGINVTPQYITQEKSTANFTLGLPYDNFMPVYHNEFTRFLTKNTYELGAYTRSLHFDTGTPTLTWEQYEAWKTGALSEIPDGNPTARFSNSASTNPISKQQERSNVYDEFRISMSASLKWKINKKLDFNTTANGYYKTVENNNTESEFYNRYENRSATNYVRSIQLFTNENTFNYKERIGGHNIAVLAGFTEEITHYKYARIQGTNIPKGMPLTLNNATLISQDGSKTFAYPEMEVLLSGLFRIMYDYKGRYLFSGSVRADGSSIFAPGKRWGYFPSLSLGWRASEEAFMQNTEFLSNLKFRVSYGLSGNNSIARYSYLDRLVARNYSDAEGQVVSGLGSQNLAKSNPDITWEKTNQINTGLDLGVLKNRITFSLDYYYTLTDDLLLQRTMPISTGFQSVWQNIGRIKNEGVELMVNTINIDKKELSWDMNINFSHNKNKVIDFGGQYRMFSYGKRANEYLMQVGLPVSNIYGWKTDGIFNSQEELDNSPHSDDDIVGSLRRVDIDRDGKITENDKTVIGNPVPKFNWGFGHKFEFKGFDLSLLFEGSHDFDIYTLDYYNAAMRDNIAELYEDAYVDEFHGNQPTAWGGVKWEFTDHILYDGSYLALRHLTFGYALSKNALKRLPFSKLRVHFSAANLFHYIYGDYKGINPEFKDAQHNNVLKGGEQSYTLPLERTFTFGLDFNF